MTVLDGLERLPERSKPYIWADYAELLCINHPDRRIGRGEVEDRMGERVEVEGEIHAAEWLSKGLAAQLPPGTRGDRFRRYATDIFAQLEYRATVFGPDYPFELTRGASLSLRRATLRRQLYIYLLLAASLRYVARPKHREIEDAFERTTAVAVRRLLPREAEVHVFGTASPRGSRYRGLVVNKIRLLANDLGEEALVKDDDFDPGDRGDSGLDVIGWVPLGDRLGGRPILFVQATCQLEWRRKQNEAGLDRWMSRIGFTASPRSVMSVPYVFRRANGVWHRRLEIENTVLLDRERLMYLLNSRRRYPTVPYDLVGEALSASSPAF